MKTNGTPVLLIAIILQLLIFATSFTTQAAPPDYRFSSYTRISGTDRQVNARYRFHSVKTGVDAIITITALTNGVTLNEFDATGNGYNEAFQPEIRVPARTSGYAEFNISFVVTGTNIPIVMLEVPLTPIDVDGRIAGGGQRVYEYDMIQWGLGLGSYVDYNLLGGELNITFDRNWVTGRNTAATDYPNIDTTAKQAMFTVVVPSIPSIVVRVGADNQGNASVDRMRSIYFSKFAYPHSFLAKPALASFRGSESNSRVDLQWSLNTDSKLSRVIIEKATNPAAFQSIGEIWMPVDGTVKTDFGFADNASKSGRTYYRLKMLAPDGSVTYSNILIFGSSASATQESLKVFPTSIQSSVTVQVKAEKAGSALFQLVDYAGRVVMQQPITVNTGNNNIAINIPGNINTGNYVAVVKMDSNMYSQKVLKQ